MQASTLALKAPDQRLALLPRASTTTNIELRFGKLASRVTSEKSSRSLNRELCVERRQLRRGENPAPVNGQGRHFSIEGSSEIEASVTDPERFVCRVRITERPRPFRRGD